MLASDSNHRNMQHFKNIFADVFSSSIFLSGWIYSIDWFKVIGAFGIIASVANHAHQMYYRKKNNNKNNEQ